MKTRLLFLIAVVTAMISCGPSKHVMHIEMRHPSKAGLSLENKVLSVVYLENDDLASSEFAAGMASGFASVLEQDLGTGEGSIGVYKMQWESGADYASRDSLITLLIDTGADVVFLFDKVEVSGALQGSDVATVPFSMKLYCFDGMDKSEQIKTYSGRSAARADGVDAGRTVANSFKSQWKTESYTLAYYDSEKWYQALDKAEAYDWKGAMEQWFNMLKSNDPMKRACAEYNIAFACYMLGDYDLALQWLDRSDEENKLPNMSDSLRKRIEMRK